MDVRPARLLGFGDFELDVRAGELRKHGVRIRLQDQSFQILLMLLERPGEVLLREEIRQKLWPNNTIVEFDHSINAAIKRLRQALGETAEDPRYIETLAKRGYRFSGQVRAEPNDQPKAVHDQSPTVATADADDLSGKTFSHYRVLEKLGSGGMGVVYRAEDLKLGRQVALKFLHSPASELPESVLQRFEREARAASALNHPHICTVYSVDNLACQPVIVMELLEGETLAARLAKGALGLDQSLALAIQVAGALAEAHRRGVVHRDLKPANIMLTKSGAKVLDFGLAKMERVVPVSADAAMVTQKGEIVGTLHYMSPEQVQGKETDARSDIFSFGLVLYEMLTGRRAFGSESPASVMAGILEREPQPPESNVPPALTRLLLQCLAKDSEERWQSARDLKRALEWTQESDAIRADSTRAASRRWAWIATAAVVFIVALAAWLWPRPASERQITNWVTVVSAPEFTSRVRRNSQMLVSPDGSAILYPGRGVSWLRRAGSIEATALQWSKDIQSPFWSYDSKHVAYLTGDHGRQVLMKRALPDGAAEEVTELSEVGGGFHGGSWHQNGTILFHDMGSLYAVNAAGGNPSRLDLKKPGRALHWPEFLPNGEDFLFVVAPIFGGDGPEICVAKLRNGKVVKGPVVLMKNPTAAHFSASGGGELLYVKNDDLFAQRLNTDTWKLVGEPHRLVHGVASWPANYAPDFSVSRTGVLAWRPGTAALRQLIWFDRKGSAIGVAGAPGLPLRVHLSNDDKQLIAAADDETRVLQPAERGFRRVNVPQPIWSPDASHLFYADSTSDGNTRVMEAPTDGVGSTREVIRLPPLWELNDISSDGRFLLYVSKAALYYVQIDGGPGQGQPHLAVQTDEGVSQGRFSPDGRWIVYNSSREGPSEIYVQAFPGGHLRTLIADDALFPVWRADGREILFLRGNRVFSVRVEAHGAEFRARPPETLFELRSLPSMTVRNNPLAVSRDGSRIMVIQEIEQPSSEVVNIATAWDLITGLETQH